MSEILMKKYKNKERITAYNVALACGRYFCFLSDPAIASQLLT